MTENFSKDVGAITFSIKIDFGILSFLVKEYSSVKCLFWCLNYVITKCVVTIKKLLNRQKLPLSQIKYPKF